MYFEDIAPSITSSHKHRIVFILCNDLPGNCDFLLHLSPVYLRSQQRITDKYANIDESEMSFTVTHLPAREYFGNYHALGRK